MSKKTEAKEVVTESQEQLGADTIALKAQARAELMKELGITQDMLDAKKAEQERAGQMMQVNLGPTVCRVNGRPYSGRVTVPAGLGEVLIEMASKKRRRILKEQFRNEHQIHQLENGGFASKLVKTTHIDQLDG